MRLPKRSCQNIKNVVLGKNVEIFDFVNLYGCKIGDNTRIGTFVEIQKNAEVGNNCKIQSHSFICEGVTIEDGVFIGHGVMFINDKYPRSVGEKGKLKTESEWKCLRTLVKKEASIGSGCTILGGITIGKKAMIGAGSVVTKNIPDGAVAYGNPACINGKNKLSRKK